MDISRRLSIICQSGSEGKSGLFSGSSISFSGDGGNGGGRGEGGGGGGDGGNDEDEDKVLSFKEVSD